MFDARRRIAEVIDIYNNKRPHTSLNYSTPREAHKMHGEQVRRWKNYYKTNESPEKNKEIILSLTTDVRTPVQASGLKFEKSIIICQQKSGRVTSFFDLVQHMIKKEDYDEFIQKRVAAKNPEMSVAQVKEVSQRIFWNLNFGFILAMIDRVTIALGARTLIKICDSVCDRMDSPVSFLIKENIAMRYQHNIRIDEIKAYDIKKLAPLTRNALLFFVNQFCKYNRIEESDRQKLKRLGLSINNQTLLLENNQDRR